MAAALLLVLLSCDARPLDPTATPEVEEATPTETATAPPPSPTVTPEVEGAIPTVAVPAHPPEPTVIGVTDSGPYFDGFTSLEERIFHSDLVVRAKLESLEGRARQECRWSDGRYWIPVVRYEFEAYEFLKGEGTESLFVNVSFGASGDSFQSRYEVYESEGGAIAAARSRLRRSAPTWREREAILFVKERPSWDGKCGEPLPESTDSYSFTLQGDVQAPEYRLDSRFNRVWLPAADVTPQGSERFLLKAPGSAPGHEAQENIGLEELRQRIAELEGSIKRAQSEGVSGYEECLSEKYYRERLNQAAIDAGGELVRHWWQHEVPPPQQRRILFSGVPADKTILGEAWQYVSGSSFDLRDKLWLAGPDAHLFRLEPESAAEPPPGRAYRPRRITASTVLPVGTYHFQLHRQEAHFLPCDYHDKLSAVDFFVDVLPPIESEEPDAPYANCIMSSAGVLPPEEWRHIAWFSIEPLSACGSAHRAESRAHYEVFQLNDSEEVEVSLTQACPLQQILLYEGTGPNDQPLHVFDPEDFLIGDADFGVLSPGTYTVEVNVLQWAECRSALIFSWQ